MTTTSWLKYVYSRFEGKLGPAKIWLGNQPEKEAKAALRVLKTKHQKNSLATMFVVEQTGFVILK